MTTDTENDDTPTADDPEFNPPPDTTRLQAQVHGAMQRLSGRCYRVRLELLPYSSLQELVRFLRDVEYAKDSAVRRARLEPWRR